MGSRCRFSLKIRLSLQVLLKKWVLARGFAPKMYFYLCFYTFLGGAGAEAIWSGEGEKPLSGCRGEGGMGGYSIANPQTADWLTAGWLIPDWQYQGNQMKPDSSPGPRSLVAPRGRRITDFWPFDVWKRIPYEISVILVKKSFKTDNSESSYDTFWF